MRSCPPGLGHHIHAGRILRSPTKPLPVFLTDSVSGDRECPKNSRFVGFPVVTQGAPSENAVGRSQSGFLAVLQRVSTTGKPV